MIGRKISRSQGAPRTNGHSREADAGLVSPVVDAAFFTVANQRLVLKATIDALQSRRIYDQPFP